MNICVNSNQVQSLTSPVDADSIVVEHQTCELKLFKMRWLILFIFSMTTLANAALFNTISAITNIAIQYYAVPSTLIDWIPNSFILIFILVAFPSAYFMTSLGLRVCMLVAASFNAIATCLHFAGVHRKSFPFILTGQLFCGLAAGVVLQLPPRLSTVWFAAKEHSKATSIAMFSNIFGVAVGYIQATQMVPLNAMTDVERGLFYLYLSQLIFCLVNLILVYLFFTEAPPLAPTYAALHTSHKYGGENISMSFLESLQLMVSDKNVIILSQAYGLYVGMYVYLSVALNELATSIAGESIIGWMGFSFNCFGILAILISGIIIDKFKCYKTLGIVSSLLSLVSWASFTYFLLHTNSIIGLFISFSSLGIFGIPFFSIGVEQGAEMTYPVPEGTSTAVNMIVANLYAFIAILFLGDLVERGHKNIVCYIVCSIYLLTFLLLCFIRMTMKRQDEEEHHNIYVNNGNPRI